MTFGEEWGWGASKEETLKMLEAFAEAGGNFIDTANKYTEGTSEEYTGEFVAADREHFVVATKYTLSMRPEDPNASGNHRKNLVQALDASLRRLATDYVDLYWVHAPDFLTPIDEIMRALDDVVRAGKVLYVGISDPYAWYAARANTMAELRGWTPFVGLQIQYSLLERSPERELLPMAEELDVGVTPWGILGGGVLSGKYGGGSGSEHPKDGRISVTGATDAHLTECNLHIADEVMRIAEEVDRTPSQVAINWVRQQPRGVIIPILGARKPSQLRDNLACLEFELSEKQLQRLDEVSQVELGFPLDYYEDVKEYVYGTTLPSIDNHRRRSWGPR
jgi:aryl-alcohol dehydrogenase-like predicted oxidoreductase